MKALLVIDTDAEHIEDLHISMIWNDAYPVELDKDVYFKPLPERKAKTLTDCESAGEWLRCCGYDECLDDILGDEDEP